MSTNSQYNFPEAKLPAGFAKEKVKEFKQLIDRGLSFVVISMPGVGASCFLKYLAVQDFAHFVHVDLYSLPALSIHEFYKLLLSELGGKSTGKSDEKLLEETNQFFLSEIKKKLKELSQKRGKVVIIFSRFDQLKNQFTPTFLSNIQSLTTISDKPVVEIFTSTKPLYDIAPDTLTGGNLNFYSENFYFKPYSKEDLKALLKVDPARPVPENVLNELLELSGGHNQLFRILLSSQKQQNLLLDNFVKMQMKEFVDYLDYFQRKQLQKIALGKKLEEVDEYLLGVGMVTQSVILSERSESKDLYHYQLFTPLLAEYIKAYLPVKLPAKEAKLFKLLRQHLDQTVSKDEIFAEIWGSSEKELEGATDWALDALIYRLRKHPFMKTNGYIIESHKKVGYTLIQT